MVISELTYDAADYLAEGVLQGYKKGIQRTVKDITTAVTGKKKLKFSKEKKPKWLSEDFSTEDEGAIRNFLKECFEVAGVGSYELQEKLKKLAAEVWQNSQSLTDFEEQARNIMLQYIPIKEQPPSGYLETNFNTAVNSAYTAAQYERLQDPDVNDLYPAYQYKTRNDDRVRPEHEALHDMVFYNNDPFLEIGLPPNDWNCRCFIIPLDQEETKAADVMPIIRDEETNKMLTSNVAPDFRRNAALDKSIYGKWLKQKYNDMPKNLTAEIKKLAKKYAAEYEIKK